MSVFDWTDLERNGLFVFVGKIWNDFREILRFNSYDFRVPFGVCSIFFCLDIIENLSGQTNRVEFSPFQLQKIDILFVLTQNPIPITNSIVLK